MTFGFAEPAWLWLAPLAGLPLYYSPLAAGGYPSHRLLPADMTSRVLDWTLRCAGALAIATLILGLAGLFRRESVVERIGIGTHIVLLLDRSRSMDDSFAGKAPTGGEESKSAAAVRLLQAFIDSRPRDRIGVAAFSTSPLFVLPLTDNRQAVGAAVRAAGLPGLAQTHIAKGLALALSYFDGTEVSGSRTILLVSDGAAVVDPASETLLRRWFAERGVHLYWIFLRTAGSPGIFETPDAADDTPQARPERYLHLFFSSLGIPYQAYEAENPEGLRRAMDDASRRENLPMRYQESRPRQDLRGPCYLLALLAVALLVFAKSRERTLC